MGLDRHLRTVVKAPMNVLLKAESFRRRIIFELVHHYYKDLGITVPLGNGLRCPISFIEAWSSFSEIFIEAEYAGAFEAMPLPSKWIDLGCHAGFFSLYVIWKRAQQGLPRNFRALLIDGDSRVKAPVEALIKVNGLAEQLRFEHGLISAHGSAQRFVERSHMASSLSYDEHLDTNAALVRTLTETQITEMLPPPYDLLKVDIEGAEFDLLAHYKDLIASTKYLLLEWHSWHPNGGDKEQVRQLVCQQGFQPVCEISAPRTVEIEGKPQQCGILLFSRLESSS